MYDKVVLEWSGSLHNSSKRVDPTGVVSGISVLVRDSEGENIYRMGLSPSGAEFTLMLITLYFAFSQLLVALVSIFISLSDKF